MRLTPDYWEWYDTNILYKRGIAMNVAVNMDRVAQANSKHVKEVLRIAAKLVAQGWAQGDRATGADGEFENTYSEYATNFPLRVAIDRATYEYAMPRRDVEWHRVYCDACDAVRREIWALPNGDRYGAIAIEDYNDDTRRTAAHVERLLKRAARNYKGQVVMEHYTR